MLRVMDNTELAIEEIKGLRMVHFYHIIKDNEFIEAVLAYYDKDKVINLCVLDKHYEKLLDRLWNLYEAEKDCNRIIMDDYSKQILEKSAEYDIEQYKNLTSGYSQIDEPMFPQSGYMKAYIVPVIRFVVNQLYVMSGQEPMWNPIGRDWFGSGEISAHCGDKKQIFPYRIKIVSEGLYSVDIGNVLMTGNNLNISIRYSEKGIELILLSTKHPMEGSIKYIFTNENLVCIADVSVEGKKVFSNVSPVDKLDNQAGVWKLPWEQVIRKTNSLIEYNYSCNDCDYSFVISYKDISANDKINYTIYNYAMSVFKSKRSDTRTQIHFCDLGYGTRGYYKANLEGKYFIEVME